jgi:hypothetical protein
VGFVRAKAAVVAVWAQHGRNDVLCSVHWTWAGLGVRYGEVWWRADVAPTMSRALSRSQLKNFSG